MTQKSSSQKVWVCGRPLPALPYFPFVRPSTYPCPPFGVKGGILISHRHLMTTS